MHCGICGGKVSDDAARAVVVNMPLVDGGGVRAAHMACYGTRALCARTVCENADAWPVPADAGERLHPPEGTACGLCRSGISEDEDCFFYPGCRHGWVHMRCMTLFDVARRPWCILCPPPAAPPPTALHSSMDLEGETYVADADLFSPPGTVEDEALLLEPASATGRVNLSREWSDAMTNNAVTPLVISPGLSMHDVEIAFVSRRRAMQEPHYATIARQYCFECGLDITVVPPVHARHQERTVLGLLSPKRCRLGDLLKVGLTLPIALRDSRDAAYFVSKVLRAAVLSKDQLPWRVSFEMLMRAGIPVGAFASTQRSFLDLRLVDFSMPVFIACGGTPAQLRTMILNMASNPVTLLSQFGLSPDMQRCL